MIKTVVSFVLWYLKILAKIQLFKVRPVIVGVGGASGKTSLCNFISLILSEKYKVLETKGKNSESGIPLTILGIKIQNYTYFEWLKALITSPFKVIFDWEKYDILIAEMGIDGPSEPKNMSYLLKIVRPRIGVLTNISYEHSVYFEEIAKNKEKILNLTSDQEALLLKSLPKEGLAVLNIDDSQIRKIKGIKASKTTISKTGVSSDFFIEKINVSLKGFKVSFFLRSQKFEIKIPIPLPDHYAYSFLMAIAICQNLGFKVEDSIKILENKFSLPAGRMSVFKGRKETTIIDSSYNNATLVPIIDILDLLKNVSGRKRKVAIVGDMRELGIVSKILHEKVARALLETTDLVFLIGPLTAKFIAPILSRNNHNFYSFNTFSEGKEIIKKKIEKNDIVLVKGSQNTLYLERAVEMLLKNSKDRNKLARRGKFWDEKRRESL